MPTPTPDDREIELLLTPRRRAWLVVFLDLLDASGPARVVSMAEAGRRMGATAEAASGHFKILRARGLVPADCSGVHRGRQELAGDEEPSPEERERIAERCRAIQAGWSPLEERYRRRWQWSRARVPGADRAG